jgi:nucleotide-binding universal stress UspA family protein
MFEAYLGLLTFRFFLKKIETQKIYLVILNFIIMNTILFPTDFSNNAFHAAKYAGLVAKRMNANLVFLNVFTMPVMSEYALPAHIEDFINESKQTAREKLKAFTHSFCELTKIPENKIKQLVEYGLVADKIIETAQTIEADIIVMGTKGATNLIDKWIGTIAQKIMKQAECPVWIIPLNTEINFPKDFLYAADLQEDEVLVTQKILDITKKFGADCKVLHIHEYFELNINNEVQHAIESLKKEFEDEQVTFKNLNRDSIINGLETYIKTHNPDVLALAVSEKSFLSKLFDPSITNHFVQKAKLPILTFRK